MVTTKGSGQRSGRWLCPQERPGLDLGPGLHRGRVPCVAWGTHTTHSCPWRSSPAARSAARSQQQARPQPGTLPQGGWHLTQAWATPTMPSLGGLLAHSHTRPRKAPNQDVGSRTRSRETWHLHLLQEDTWALQPHPNPDHVGLGHPRPACAVGTPLELHSGWSAQSLLSQYHNVP